MGSRFLKSTKRLIVTIASFVLLGSILGAQGKDPGKGAQQPDHNASTQLRIEITAGEKAAPVEMASVYVRYVVKHTMAKDENIEMNIKTNKEGVAIANGIPRGKVLVQVIAEGWKTFGKWYDATEDEQTIKIRLEKPPRWF